MEWIKKFWSWLRKDKEREKVIILDTCALKTKKAMKIIDEASKVVLLLGTIREMDGKQKNSTKLYKENKEAILRESRKDQEGKKYVCVAKYEKHSYVDDNIIDYCRKHRKVIILTCDNNLCSKAKAYHIPYIFPEENEASITQANQKIEKCQNIKGVIFENGSLYFEKEEENHKTFVMKDSQTLQLGENIKSIELSIGDIVIQIRNNKNKIVLCKYEIQSIKRYKYADYQCFSEMVDVSDLQRLEQYSLPEIIHQYAYQLLCNAKEKEKEELVITNQTEQIEEAKSEKKQEGKIQSSSKQILLLKNFILVKPIKGYKIHFKLVRNEETIPLNDYEEGDQIYLFKYHEKSHLLEVIVYTIIQENNKYDVCEFQKHEIRCINDIYRLAIAEGLQEEVRKFYLKQQSY